MTSDISHLQTLLQKGVTVPHPSSVFISEEVNPDRIHASVTLHPGSRIQGSLTSMGPGTVIGKEAPATVHNCQLGANVSLKGGFFEGSVFLEGSNVGSSAHIRPGCLFEEEASAAHAVGLKQTILFPFVTLGSLVNFCDLMMSGGTSRKNHSEVGSSFIHFNFTPHSDKATASIIGDISRGVLLNQAPIFLGGQGGIVGPVEIEFGVVQAAGSICRHDLMEPGHLYQSCVKEERWGPYKTGRIRDPGVKWTKNLKYIGSLSALKTWYQVFRTAVMPQDPYHAACIEGAVGLLEASVAERLKQLEKWVGLLEDSRWESAYRKVLAYCGESANAETLNSVLRQEITLKASYPETIQNLSSEQQEKIVQYFETEMNRFTVLTVETIKETCL